MPSNFLRGMPLVSELEGAAAGCYPTCLIPGLTWRTVLFGPEQTRRSLSYKPRDEIEGLEKQASYLITTK